LHYNYKKGLSKAKTSIFIVLSPCGYYIDNIRSEAVQSVQ